MNVALDTLSVVRRLRNAGFTEEQTDAVAQAVRDAATLPDTSNLASRDEMRAEINGVHIEIKAATNDTLKWVFIMIMSALVLNIGATAGLIKLLIPPIVK